MTLGSNDRAALVRVFRADQKVFEVPLERSRYVIGRNQDAEICLDDPTVSRPHAELVCGPFGRWWIHDLGSTNGTKIAGTPITGKMLHHRDQVKVGDFVLEFRHAPRDSSLRPQSKLLEDSSSTTSSVGEETIQIAMVAPSSTSAQILPIHLATVTAVGRRMLTTENADERLAHLLDCLVGEGMPADSAVALRVGKDASSSVLAGPFHRFGPSEQGPYLSHAVLRAVLETHETVVATNLDEMHNDVEVSLPASVRPVALVASPLAISRDYLDVLYVEFPWRYATRQWQSMVDLLADNYRQARMVWQMRHDLLASARIEHDLEMANDLQKRLLPDCSKVHSLDVAVGYQPSQWVGGDYVDVLQLEDGRVLLVIADVCGKGLSAALVSSSVHTMVHAHADTHGDIHRLVRRLNGYLCAHLPDASFVTLTAVAIDPRTGTLDVLNAGHPAPILVSHTGELTWLQSERNVAVGMVEDATFEVQRTRFSPGDTLLLYTDGAFEGFDDEGEWTPDEIAQLVQSYVTSNSNVVSADLERHLTRTLDDRRGAHFQADDTTFLVARLPWR